MDAVDTAIAALAGTTSQVSMSALVAATDNTERETGLCLEHVAGWNPIGKPYGKSTHRLNRAAGTNWSNLRARDPRWSAIQPAPAGYRIGLGERFESIENMYAAANNILGDIVKVTPSSKVVGDLALALGICQR